ncbi:hypothetical protein QUB60_21470 [Microcoleus sp. A2-C5]|uniref:hypothetical protein n=1 Tax=unclassified Microcoleus TaxID=2642155 RepID=UPI002FCEF3EF
MENLRKIDRLWLLELPDAGWKRDLHPISPVVWRQAIEFARSTSHFPQDVL